MSYNPPSGDFVTTSLNGVLAAAATSATIGTGLTIPGTDGILHLSYDTANAIGATDGPETISYSSYTTGTGALSGLVRGLAGTTDVEHSNGQSVQSAFSALHFSLTPVRVTTITSSATPIVNTDNCDAVTITALATAITSMTTSLTGTPTNFQKLIVRIKDDGTARAITWGAKFAARGVPLPTTTVLGKVLTVGFVYNSVAAVWDCVASAQEA